MTRETNMTNRILKSWISDSLKTTCANSTLSHSLLPLPNPPPLGERTYAPPPSGGEVGRGEGVTGMLM